jgi:hypothetical protein
MANHMKVRGAEPLTCLKATTIWSQAIGFCSFLKFGVCELGFCLNLILEIWNFSVHPGFIVAGLSDDEYLLLKSSNLHRLETIHPFYTGNRITRTIFDRGKENFWENKFYF